jgi:hypothetical protein
MKLTFKYLLPMASLLVLGGCQTIYEGKYDWDEGWRPGTVLEVGSADQAAKEPFRDCRKGLSVVEKSAVKFAVVRYSHLSQPQKAVIPIAPESTWSRGDPVYINVLSCKIALERRSNGG